jgi:hypothetical protein
LILILEAIPENIVELGVARGKILNYYRFNSKKLKLFEVGIGPRFFSWLPRLFP